MAHYVPSTVLEDVKNHFSSGETAGVVSFIYNKSLFWAIKRVRKLKYLRLVLSPLEIGKCGSSIAIFQFCQTS